MEAIQWLMVGECDWFTTFFAPCIICVVCMSELFLNFICLMDKQRCVILFDFIALACRAFQVRAEQFLDFLGKDRILRIIPYVKQDGVLSELP